MSRLCVEVQQTVLLEAGTASCSGIIVDTDRGLVVTHASLLLPQFNNRPATFRQFIHSGCSNIELLDLPPVKVTFERCRPRLASQQSSYTATLVNVSLSDTSASRQTDQTVLHCTGKVCRIRRTKNFASTVSQMFPGSEWKFWDEPHLSESDAKGKLSRDLSAERMLALLPYFALISVGDALKPFQLKRFQSPDAPLNSSSPQRLNIGDVVYVIGTPFGNLSAPVFLNSVSKGIISNIAGSHQELILTDARCIPGTEGGAVYLASRSAGDPVGMVVAPLCWKTNEWIGLSLGCRLDCILQSLCENISISNEQLDDVVSSADRHSELSSVCARVPVVLVQSANGSWGSGVIVDQSQGLVLTCGHVVKAYSTANVRLRLKPTEDAVADVLFSSKAGDVYDLAVLKLRRYRLRDYWSAQVAVDLPQQSEDVFVVGHAAWGMQYKRQASVTTGVVSRVLYRDDVPVLIQTSSAVNAGASGAPLINRTGCVLGLVVCNARDMLSGACYPHVNFSVPMMAVWNVIKTFISTQDVNVLQQLVTDDRYVRDVWSLGSGVTVSMESADIRCKL